MAFRFNNPLTRVKNLQAQANRGLGGFGQFQSGLSDINNAKRSISNIASSVGNIAGNSTSIRDTITNIGSAGGVINALGNNTSISNTVRSISALTGDINSLVPGNNRVASQAVTLSKKAGDLFANTQKNINQFKNITGGAQDTFNGSLDVGNLANRSLGKITGGLDISSLQSLGGLTKGINPSLTKSLTSIAASAPELQSIITKPLRVVPRSVAELTSTVGSRFDTLRVQYNELKAASTFDSFSSMAMNSGFGNPIAQSPLGQFADLPPGAYGGVSTGAGASFSKIANPLRSHASFNYVITLGILSADEYNNPTSYRQAGFKNYIIRSGGGNYSERYQTFEEFNGNDNGSQDHAEYFIDDIDMDAVIAPNPNTNVALGTALTFNVTEPYSMGMFIEAIIGSAASAGFNNYLDAPFCLRVDFVGWDEYGKKNENYVTKPIFVPVKLVNVEFNVSGKGSTYECKAVPMSETGLSDDINEIKTPVNLNGDFLHTVLETGARSLTQVMNDRIEGLESAGTIAPYDRYVIVFPKSRQRLQDYLKQDIIDEDALKIDVSSRIEDFIGANTIVLTEEEQVENAISGLTGEPHPSGFDGAKAGELATLTASLNQRNQDIINATISSAGKMFAKLKTFAEDEGEMNEIGLSTLVEESGAGGNQAHGSYAATVTDNNDPRGTAGRNTADLATAEKSRDYQFNQGMTITEVIERMVVSSEYARQNAEEPPENGIVKHFKIDTLTFIEENPKTEAQMGRPPKVYVYSIIPYEADEAKFNAASERPANTEGLKAAAAKEYNYIYTGKNEDVLDFNIQFNNAFLQTAFGNFGQNAAGVAAGSANQSTAQNRSTGSSLQAGKTAAKGSPTGGTQEAVSFGSAGFGDAVGSGDMRRRIAEMRHDRMVNQVTDMVTAEMEIYGDPFFIPQEMGNFVAKPSGTSPNTTEDGTMTYQQSEVFCVVNFATPFDYQIGGSTIEFPKAVPQFSGLYSIWAVNTRFTGGKFLQTLKMIRRRGQDDEPTDNNTGPVQQDNEADITGNQDSNDNTTGNTNANAGSTTLSNNNASSTTPNQTVTNLNGSTPTSTGAGIVSTDPTGRKFQSMDQAVRSARAFQQNNAGFNYAIQQGPNNSWTIAPRQATTPVVTDLSSNVAGSAGAQSNAPTSPAC